MMLARARYPFGSPFLPSRAGARKAGPVSAFAELTAVSTTLGELSERLSNMLAELTPAEDDRYGADLLEVERALEVAHRKLERLLTTK